MYMQACVMKARDGRPESVGIERVPIPRPGNDEVLVRVLKTPINPSDRLFLRGRYGQHRPLPAIPGMECCGMVIDSGGVLGQLLIGRRVACMATSDTGTWAEYTLANVAQCVPLRQHVSEEQGALLFVGPLTAWALVQSLRKGRHQAGVQTAAASALGQVVLRLCERDRIPMIHIVRRPEQVALLRDLGAEWVLNSSESSFDRDLTDLCRELRVTMAFDAVAGEMTGRLLRALPRGAHVTVFGSLSEQPCQIDPDQLIFEHKEVNGFLLSDWFPTGFSGGQNPLTQLAGLLDSERSVGVRASYPLGAIQEALQVAAEAITGGKVLLAPQPRKK